MCKTRAKDDHHQKTPYRSSYAAQMKKLEKHKTFDSATRESLTDDIRTGQSRGRLTMLFHNRTIMRQHQRSHTSRHTKISHCWLVICQPQWHASLAQVKRKEEHKLQDDASRGEAKQNDNVIRPCTARSRSLPEEVTRE
jgi:hypothetical protein